MKIHVLPLALLLAMPTSAEARLGETMAQLTARFGQPITTRKHEAIFEKNGVEIRVSGWQGICCEIQYKQDDFFSDQQLQELLRSNCPPGQRWVREDGVSGVGIYNTPDKTFRVVYSGNKITFLNYNLIWARQKAEERERAKSTAGF